MGSNYATNKTITSVGVPSTNPQCEAASAASSQCIKGDLRSLILTGLVLGSTGLMNTTAAAAIQTCGKPPLHSNESAAVLLWEDCNKGAWSVAVTGGGSDQLLTCNGTIKASRPATLVEHAQGMALEPNDILKVADKQN